VLRLGLLSTARINARVIRGAAASDRVEVVAVGSRGAAKAQAYAGEHGLARAHGSYEALLDDPEVDAVYISLPNSLHVLWTLRALEAGKHVLCEKPLSRHPEEVEEVFDAADAAGLVVAEAFMWRHHPQACRLVELLRDGVIGELRLVRSTFRFSLDRPGDIRFSDDLDGGALMDVGCYCVSGSRLLAGEPIAADGVKVPGPGGADVRVAGVLGFENGVVGVIDAAIDLPGLARLEVNGSDGTLVLDDPWIGTHARITLHRDGRSEDLAVEQADPYRLELEDLAAAADGSGQSLLGRADALGQARALEALHAGVTIEPATPATEEA
jgi:D-xylose 1-dehydrogenase (NADP+, D-xylono-1,5-lactone-forming)